MGRKHLATALRFAFVAAALGLGGYAVASQWQAVHGELGRLQLSAYLTSLVAVVVGLVASMLVWRALLAGLGSGLSVRVAGGIFFVGQLGKYLPGSVWPMLAQMELGRRHQVPRAKSAAAFLLVTMVMLATGCGCAAIVLPLAGIGLPGAVDPMAYRWVLAAGLLTLGFLHPRLLGWLLTLALRLARRPPLDSPMPYPALLTALGWAVVAWSGYGVHVWLLLRPLAGGQPAVSPVTAVALATGGFALAWCAGLLAFVVPAGVGVREAALVAVVSPLLDRPSGLVVALVSRLLVTVGDLLLAGAAALAGPRVRVATADGVETAALADAAAGQPGETAERSPVATR